MHGHLSEALLALRPARPRPLPPVEHQRVLSSARIERHGDLTALYLSGTAYEMGYQHGFLARERIQGFREAAYTYVASLIGKPNWLARPLLYHEAAAYWPTIPAALVQEMDGIADGAGIHPIEVLASTAIWEMFLVSGCSEFAAVGPVTADGGLVHGYNYDLMHPDHALIQPYLAALFYQPAEGLPFMTVNTVGSVGANAGINSAGMSVAWDNTYLKDNMLTQGIELPAVPFIITLRRLLQFSQSIKSAIHTVTDTLPRSLGDIIIIGSANEGRAIAQETAGHVHAVREMEGGAIWSTNCFRSPALAPHDRRGEADSLSPAMSRRQFPRYNAYADLFAAAQGDLTPERAAAFLRDPYPREAKGFALTGQTPRGTICRDITSWSLVMQPGQGRVWVSDTHLPACQSEFFAFDLNQQRRLPDHDLAATGYHAALRCAECLLAGELDQASLALEHAMAADGATAPHMLVQALLYGLALEDQRAAECSQQVGASWRGTRAADLARSWAEDQPELAASSVPYPSSIRPLIELQAAAGWHGRWKAGPASEQRVANS